MISQILQGIWFGATSIMGWYVSVADECMGKTLEVYIVEPAIGPHKDTADISRRASQERREIMEGRSIIGYGYGTAEASGVLVQSQI